jgi:H+/Cl- antiporter ClcA
MKTSDSTTNHKTSDALHYYGSRIRQDLTNLVKWLILAILVGCVVGAASSLFAFVLGSVTSFREGHGWIFYLLPVAGVCIVFLYQKIGKEDGGTNQVLSTIRSQDEVPLLSAPLIFVSTALTHLTGGSAGREGAAIQLGGSIGNQLGRWFHLDEEDRHVMVMCGMSAAFSAVFGTPMAAAVFSMEVVSVGVMYYTALLPCVTASLIASNFASSFGIHPEAFHVVDIPKLTIVTGGKMVLVACACAVVSILFCLLLHVTGSLYKRIANPYVRIIVASALIILITTLLGTTDYMGAGNGLIEKAVEHGQAGYATFLLKMLLTALTMKAGFRGGEIVPSFCVGATFGCVMGQLLGLSPSICAAAGMAALFCGMTNCPITSILIAFELFGFEGVSYYLIAVAISYAVSGYYGLYNDQTIVYSKYKARYVNHRTRT